MVVPDATVERLGLETWSAMQRRMRPSADRSAQARVRRIADRLLLADGQDPRAWDVQVFAEPGVNAFVLPGRKIGVLEGMVDLAETDDELAAVIGHEIGHLAADHVQERLTGEVAQNVVLRFVAWLLAANEVAFSQEIAAALGAGAEFGLARPYGRAQELEADRIGLFLMAKAGYDPEAAVTLWTRMDAIGGGRFPAILSTHPAPRTRIEEIRELIPAARAAGTAPGARAN